MAGSAQVDPLQLWRELLALRLPNPVCPLCSGGDWHEIGTTQTSGTEAVGFACTTCGFIRLHSREL